MSVPCLIFKCNTFLIFLIFCAMCGTKLMEKERTEDLMEMLELKETVLQMAKVNGVRWYGHVLRRDDGHVLRKALEFEVKGKRK